MKKTLIALLLILCMLPVCAWAEAVRITFVANNDTDDSYVLVANSGEMFMTPAADRFEAPEGKKFYCWLAQTPGYIDQLEPGVMVDVFDTDTTVTADWVDENVEMLSITIDPNGGTLAEGISKTVEAAKGKDALLPPWSVVEAPAGKMFYGWDVDGKTYPGGGVYKNLQKALTLKAVYIADNAMIAEVGFHANGGTGSMNAAGIELGDTYTLPACAYTAPEGMRFKCWNINGTEYAPGAQIVVDNGMTVKAVWESVPTYTVSFGANGGSGTMASVTVNEEETITLPECGFTAPKGREFAYWIVGGVPTEVGKKVTVTSNMTIDAWWVIKACQVKLDPGAGTGEAISEKMYYGDELNLYDAANYGYEYEGHRFIGWNDGVKTYAAGEKYEILADVVLTAQWEAVAKVMHTITFVDSNDPSKTYTFDVEEGGEFLLPSAANCGFAAVSGQTFAYWSFDRDGVQEQLPVGTRFFKIGSDLTFTAMWEMAAQTETRVEQKSLESLTAEEEKEMLADMPAKLDTVEEIVTQLTIAAVKEGFEEEKVEVRDVTLVYSVDGGDNWIPATEENFPTAGITVELDLPEGTNAADYEFVVTHMFTVDSERLGTKAGETETPEVTIRNGKIVVTLTGLSPVSVSWKEKPISVDLPKTGDASCLMGWIALLGASGAGFAGMKRRKK